MKRRGSLGITTFLCQRDSVIFQKDDFQAVAHHRIVVDHLADGCDQADDHLGCVVSRGSLGTESWSQRIRSDSFKDTDE